jgi:hypothetical protein
MFGARSVLLTYSVGIGTYVFRHRLLTDIVIIGIAPKGNNLREVDGVVTIHEPWRYDVNIPSRELLTNANVRRKLYHTTILRQAHAVQRQRILGAGESRMKQQK